MLERYDAILQASLSFVGQLVAIPAGLEATLDVEERILGRLRSCALERTQLFQIVLHHVFVQLFLVHLVLVVPIERWLVARILLGHRHESTIEFVLVDRLL